MMIKIAEEVVKADGGDFRCLLFSGRRTKSWGGKRRKIQNMGPKNLWPKERKKMKNFIKNSKKILDNQTLFDYHMRVRA